MNAVGRASFAMTDLELVTRVVVALLAGAAIGWEREVHRKPAGLRTHATVALAAASAMVAVELMRFSGSGAPGDTGRVVQGVLTGMGFIGAGTIMRHPGSVEGLTTAATVWMAGVIGLAAGAGLFTLAAVAGSLTLLEVEVLRRLEPPQKAAPEDHDD